MANQFTTNSPWTPERVETLERMVAAGWTGQKISDAMGLTRSTVMGKISRSKLTLKTRHGDPKPRKASQRLHRRVLPPEATQPAPGDENASDLFYIAAIAAPSLTRTAPGTRGSPIVPSTNKGNNRNGQRKAFGIGTEKSEGPAKRIAE